MRAIALAVALFMTACEPSTPSQRHRLAPAAARGGVTISEAPIRVGIGRVEVAAYLARPALAVRGPDGEVRGAELHEWAVPIEDELRLTLRWQISQALGFALDPDQTDQPRWDLTLDVRIDHLHGALEGEALLDADWQLRKGRETDPTLTQRFADTVPLREAGYAGLVAAEVELLDRLSQSIADAIEEVSAGGR